MRLLRFQPPRLQIWYACLIALICIGASTCTKAFKIDPSPQSVLANDLTALADPSDLLGCGTQLQAGLLFCRLHERTPTTSKITFVGPKTNCKREACVYIDVFFPNGEPTLGLKIPKDKTEISVTWREVTGRDEFTLDERGFWPFVRTTFWLNADGQEAKTVEDGMIYLRILRADYESLQDTKENPYYAFQGDHHGTHWKWTTSGRTWVERKAP